MTDPKEDLPPLRSTDTSLPIALLRAREAVMEPIREMLARSGISEQKWRVLRVVEERGPVEQSQIAQEACLLLPSLTRILRAMEADGYVARRAGEDRRKSLVTITDRGRALINEHVDESNAIFARLEAAYGAEDMAHLIALLGKLRRTQLRG